MTHIKYQQDQFSPRILTLMKVSLQSQSQQIIDLFKTKEKLLREVFMKPKNEKNWRRWDIFNLSKIVFDFSSFIYFKIQSLIDINLNLLHYYFHSHLGQDGGLWICSLFFVGVVPSLSMDVQEELSLHLHQLLLGFSDLNLSPIIWSLFFSSEP